MSGLDILGGGEWHDATGRHLLVNAVNAGDPLGREVVGYVWRADVTGAGEQYSCTLETWAAVWQNKTPAWEGQV